MTVTFFPPIEGLEMTLDVSTNKVVAITIPSDSNPQEHEDTHVHAIYDQIATHFSTTRYKVCRFSLFGVKDDIEGLFSRGL